LVRSEVGAPDCGGVVSEVIAALGRAAIRDSPPYGATGGETLQYNFVPSARRTDVRLAAPAIIIMHSEQTTGSAAEGLTRGSCHLTTHPMPGPGWAQ
jgi:hypothetical protein